MSTVPVMETWVVVEIVLALTGGGSLVSPLVILDIGLLFLVLVGIQQRAEAHR